MGGTSKLDACIQVVCQNKDNGRGKLIFCHFRKEIDIIARQLCEEGFTHVYTYDGRNRFTDLQRYLKNGAYVLIVQIQTGCEGLNLQDNFSEVYFVSPNWNPFVEQQAIARCYRRGQKNRVDVYRFVMAKFYDESSSIEMHIETVQTTKINMSQDLFGC